MLVPTQRCKTGERVYRTDRLQVLNLNDLRRRGQRQFLSAFTASPLERDHRSVPSGEILAPHLNSVGIPHSCSLAMLGDGQRKVFGERANGA